MNETTCKIINSNLREIKKLKKFNCCLLNRIKALEQKVTVVEDTVAFKYFNGSLSRMEDDELSVNIVADTYVNVLQAVSVIAPIPPLTQTPLQQFSYQQHTATSGGIWKYIGTDPTSVYAIGNVAMNATDVNHQLCMAIFVNGILVPGSIQAAKVENDVFSSGQLSTSSIIELNPGDTLEMRISHNVSEELILYSFSFLAYSF